MEFMGRKSVMDKTEAIKAMLEGKRVRQSNWSAGAFLEYGKFGKYGTPSFTYEDGYEVDINQFQTLDWELHEEPKKSLTFDTPLGEIVARPYITSDFVLLDLADRRGWHMEGGLSDAC